MKIYFVRHGHPDYKNDCLTELGKRHAEAAADFLKDSGISQIYASTNGRAYETAEYTAKRLGVSIVPCPFMREIAWGSVDGEEIPENGHPWKLSRAMASRGECLADPNWREKYPYSHSKVLECEKTVISGFDGWLEQFGYKREGDFYRVSGTDTDKTVAMFSHGGSSSVAMSHFLNIPFPLFCGIFLISFTGVIVAELSNEIGALVSPRIRYYGAEHTNNITE